MKSKFILIICFVFAGCLIASAQQGYFYKKEVKEIESDWHRIVIPKDVYPRVSSNLSDLRIYGFTAEGDTVEAPYLLERKKAKVNTETISFTQLNTAKNANGFFYTFKLPEATQINELKLDFKVQNFDWKVSLEGSHDQKEWFTILEKYRLVSVQNDLTSFTFTTLLFPEADYTYYRVGVKSDADPQLTSTVISNKKRVPGDYQNFEVSKTNIKENAQSRTTEIYIDLAQRAPVSSLRIPVKNEFDYYRNFTITNIIDSTKTEKGWQYNYGQIASGILQSINGNNEFTFPETFAEKLKITIYNQDNQPLDFGIPEVKGYQHELIARFSTPASYFLYFGNKKASAPNYDLQNFSQTIPDAISPLSLGATKIVVVPTKSTKKPLFENKLWLWLLMALVMAVLGWFTYKMIAKTEKEK
ncbi:DUF3999 family protein [Flavobacteriaceae bacterium M23B6Z8]